MLKGHRSTRGKTKVLWILRSTIMKLSRQGVRDFDAEMARQFCAARISEPEILSNQKFLNANTRRFILPSIHRTNRRRDVRKINRWIKR